MLFSPMLDNAVRASRSLHHFKMRPATVGLYSRTTLVVRQNGSRDSWSVSRSDIAVGCFCCVSNSVFTPSEHSGTSYQNLTEWRNVPHPDDCRVHVHLPEKRVLHGSNFPYQSLDQEQHDLRPLLVLRRIQQQHASGVR